MDYAPPRHFLLRRRTDAITDKDLAYFELALQRQLADAAYYYSLPRPGVTLVPPDTDLGDLAVAIDFVDDDGEQAGIAHHGWSPECKLAWALVGVKEGARHWQRAASHEALEFLINMQLDQFEVADGGTWAKEVCDPVEAYAYPMGINLFDEGRLVELSDYVFPSFWQEDGRYPWDYLGMLEAPFTIAPGGYAVVEQGGQRLGLGGGARHGSAATPRATSRAARLLRGPEGSSAALAGTTRGGLPGLLR